MADSEKVPEQQQQQQAAPVKTEGNENAASTTGEEQQQSPPKQVIAEKVTGTVKWFNVKSGYGFINRNDTKEDVFVHQTAIVKNNPKKAVRSVGDGEVVEFDVVLGDKGNEAANVTGPDGEPVRGSPYAAEKRRGVRYVRPRRRGPRADGTGGEDTGGEGNISGDGGDPQKRQHKRRFGPRRRFGGPGRRVRRNEAGEIINGDGGEGGNTGGESGGEGDGGQNQNGHQKRYFRRNYRQPRTRRPPRTSEGGGDGQDGGDGIGANANGQPRKNKRYNRKPRRSGTDQDGDGQQVQNTVTESTA